jgi:DNA-binding GntR family transcriptional regulator
MDRQYISKLLSQYGLRQILADSNITIVEALEVLEELGFIDLEQYGDEHGADD